MTEQDFIDAIMRIENKVDAILFYLDQLTNEELVMIDPNELKDGE